MREHAETQDREKTWSHRSPPGGLGGSFLILCLSFVWSVQAALAACGEHLTATQQALVAEEQTFRLTEQRVRAAREEMLRSETALRTTRNDSPQDYAPELSKKLRSLYRTEVAPKLHTLEWLRAQHEEARRHWERGHRLLRAQLVEVQAAFTAMTLSPSDYCTAQKRYVQGLQLYQRGTQRYRTGMELYAQALDAYGSRFLLPYQQADLYPYFLSFVEETKL